MKVSKNIHKGGKIENISYLLQLAKDKQSVVVKGGWGYWVRPAAFMIHWPLANLARFEFFYAIKDSDITEVEFEN